MKKILNWKQILINILPLLIVIISLFLLNNQDFSLLLKLLIFNVSIIIAFLSFYADMKNIKILKKILIFIHYAASIIIIIYAILNKFNLERYMTSPTAIKDLILSTGRLGKFVFILIQILQVILIPIPSVVIVLVGTLIYGPLLCTIYCILGVIIGSLISFMIGRTFGKKLVYWFFGKEKVDKYLIKIKGREGLFIALVFIFPFMPDDILCMVAGITPIKFFKFFIITILIRPISVILMCYFGGSIFGTGNLVFAFIFLIVFVIILGIIAYKNKNQISTVFRK